MGNPLADALDFTPEDKNQEEVQPQETQEKEVEQEEVLSNTEENTTGEEPVEPTEQPTVEITDDLLFARLSEMAGKEVNSLEDLVTEKEVVKEVDKPREYLSKFGEGYDKFFHDTGRNPEDYIALQRDVKSLSTEEVIKESLKNQNPNLDKAEINFLFDKQFSIDEDIMEDNEIMEKKINLKMAYNKGVTELESMKDKYLTPLDNAPASIQANAEQQKQSIIDAQELWKKDVAKDNAEIKGVEIELEGLKFTHTISEEDKKVLKDVASDNTMTKWADYYKREDGSMDTKKIQKDIYTARNIDKIVADAVKQAKATQIEETIKTDKNIDFKSGGKPTVQPTLSKKAEQENDIFKRRFNIK